MTDVEEVRHWDRLVEQLQAHRESVGSPSYGEIAERIQQDRMERGAPDYAARIARSSVYDAFRLGRTRVNIPLVREIAVALGAKPSQVEEWIAACNKPTPDLLAEEEDVPPPSAKQVLLFMLACFVMNMIGRELVDTLHLPIYLDMVGTALAAITLGPWRGAAVGLSTSLIGALTSGWVSIPFGLVEVAGALVWGYGIKRYAMGRTLPRFFALSLVAAVVCSAFAVPIIIALNGESFKDAHGMVVDLMKQTFPNRWLASIAANLFTSTLDKLISSFVALVGLSMLPLAFRRGSQVLLADPKVHPVK